MPLNRLLFIVACVIAAAAATVYVGLALAERNELPGSGLVALTIIALCASFGWRLFTDRKAKKDDDVK